MKIIYAISAIQYDLKHLESDSKLNTRIIFGYFSNLKRVHSQLKGKNIFSYSTVARKIKQNKVLILHDANIVIDKKTYKVKQLSIRVLEINKIYGIGKRIDIESLIAGEVYSNELGLLIAN